MKNTKQKKRRGRPAKQAPVSRVTVTYTADSLEAIAKFFDERSAAAQQQATNTTATKRYVAAAQATAIAWEQAATVLRNTTLVR